jgi:ABC-type maltose transport system permease subunit
MADDLEHLVRQSLNAVDRSRRWAIVATAVLFILILFALASTMASARVEDPGRSKLLFVTVVAQMVFVALCTSLLAFHVTRMTKAVLRAVELTSRGRKSSE